MTDERARSGGREGGGTIDGAEAYREVRGDAVDIRFPPDGLERSDVDGSSDVDIYWWLLTRTAVAAPIGTFVLLLTVIETTPEEPPLATGTALVVPLSIGAGWLTFMTAAGEDRRS